MRSLIVFGFVAAALLMMIAGEDAKAIAMAILAVVAGQFGYDEDDDDEAAA